jgi:hypothetical protein
VHPVRLATVPTFDTAASPSPPPEHTVWQADYPFPNLPVRGPCQVDWQDPEIASATKAPPCWDPGWNTHSHYVQNGPGNVLAVDQERYRRGTTRQASYDGVKFYDISDRATPRFLSYWEAPVLPPDAESGVLADSRGTHHFNFDGPYLYLGTEYEGYIGKILVILDVRDPSHPVETGKWWIPGQKTPEEDALRDWEQQPSFSSPVVRKENGKWTKHVGMHYATVQDDIAYLSYHQAGLVVLDVSKRSHPRLLSRTDYLLPDADPSNPDIGACQKAAGGQPADAVRFPRRPASSHLGNPISDAVYLMAWYGNGLQAIDISDPAHPVSAGHYNYRVDRELDEPHAQYAGSDTYDVIIGRDGYLYVSDGTSGLRVLRYTGNTSR